MGKLETTGMASSGARGLTIAAVIVLGTVLCVLGLLLPDLWRFAPGPIRERPFEVAAMSTLAAYGMLRGLVARRRIRWAKRRLIDIEILAAHLLPQGLSLGMALLAAGLFLGWLPNYLTWPWCRDADTFATLAIGWKQGVVPYRDVRAYNFPGHIYLHWILGQTFGWGHTVPYQAVDALGIALLGVVLAMWSRRLSGTRLPGLGAFLAYLSFALGLEYEMTAQRDAHAALLAVLGLLAAETWPDGRGRIVSAAAMAAALTIRPHALLFLPAMAAALVERLPRPLDWRLSGRVLGIWALAFAGFTLVAFTPLIVAGVADDLARGLRVAAYGGPYSRATPASMLRVAIEPFHDPWTVFVLASVALLAIAGPVVTRRPARTWFLAMLAALAYRPLHPVQHDYLVHPRELVTAVALALPLAAIVGASRLTRVVIVVILVHQALPAIPRYCLPRDSVQAFDVLARGDRRRVPPAGAHRFFGSRPENGAYVWRDYQDTLDYLKCHTEATTPVANVLRRVPFPSVNGPIGRPSPFRAESGICWMWLVDNDLDAAFAAELKAANGAVVVWVPDEEAEPRLRLPRLTAAIREHFRPEARFGVIEVWGRIP